MASSRRPAPSSYATVTEPSPLKVRSSSLGTSCACAPVAASNAAAAVKDRIGIGGVLVQPAAPNEKPRPIRQRSEVEALDRHDAAVRQGQRAAACTREVEARFTWAWCGLR